MWCDVTWATEVAFKGYGAQHFTINHSHYKVPLKKMHDLASVYTSKQDHCAKVVCILPFHFWEKIVRGEFVNWR